jgi:hypothetical protein
MLSMWDSVLARRQWHGTRTSSKKKTRLASSQLLRHAAPCITTRAPGLSAHIEHTSPPRATQGQGMVAPASLMSAAILPVIWL